MATFFDGPDGRLFMSAPVGGGEFNGLATERDIMLNPDAYAAYLSAKQRAVKEAEEAIDVAKAEEAPKIEAEIKPEPVDSTGETPKED